MASRKAELLCRALGIEHRRTKPRTPRTNGMVERFNGRIGREVLVMCVGTHNALERLLQGYNLAYNARRQRVLKGRSPDDVVRERLREKPQLANSAYHPPDPSHVAAVTAEPQRAVISAKEVSQPNS